MWEILSIIGRFDMPMLRHALSGTEYHDNGDGTVLVVGKNGKTGVFTRSGEWISGERRTADTEMCRWVSFSDRKSYFRRV
ncbi:hypothetical protein J2W40_003950 [Sphingobium xenophagum]|uniref:Uncharacterized protein n=1 Tax=Sphingobium xenophagum TaxID=121428 RepID=A0ABU1X7J7_SPHXE|nr:hypothetical protein [Sphingobium xenophagum]MDR7157102.1 hypothetical protein [Sphingobium xenophagum]